MSATDLIRGIWQPLIAESSHLVAIQERACMNTTNESSRGTVIKIPQGDQPGLIMANGQQVPFTLEGLWQSSTAPAPNQTVEFERDGTGQITRITVVDRQTLTREKLGDFAGMSGEQGQQAATVAKGLYGRLVARMGYPMFIGCILLWIAWFFLPALVVHAGLGSASFSFSRITGYSMNGVNPGSSLGFWSFLGLLCIIAPWVVPWLQKSWARFLALAPIVFVILTWIRLSWSIHHATSKLGDAMGSRFAQMMADKISNMVSYGFGMWVVVLISVFIAAWGFVHYRKKAAPAVMMD
ncbi:MAG TPA: hypothetical protein VFJ15_08105 [Oleiagrimonas sp.]|nr:hypothetical protein [Oleiagrimonas sp.]